jgi:SAM-dependent methyltransferase
VKTTGVPYGIVGCKVKKIFPYKSVLFSERKRDFFCPICGEVSKFELPTDTDPRESIYCSFCGSFNRQRQIALVICSFFGSGSLKEMDSRRIFNTECRGALHSVLKDNQNYCCSETENLMNLSFEDSVFDLVISSDVMEHVSNPYLGFKEIYRVLKPGGRHIFTMSFNPEYFLDEIRAEMVEEKLIHLKEPLMHLDPLDPDGCLVYTVFGLEMLVKLAHIGFHTNWYQICDYHYGTIGNNGHVFESIKEKKWKREWMSML